MTQQRVYRNDRQTISSVKWAAVTLLLVMMVIAMSLVFVRLRPAQLVSNFEECIHTGGARMESYPERCAYQGKTYTNEMQRPAYDKNGFIGMTEDDALTKAEKSNTPARVVERDGEGLPATMDFVYGRHNFYIKDNQVYKVEIEGQALENEPIDAPERE